MKISNKCYIVAASFFEAFILWLVSVIVSGNLKISSNSPWQIVLGIIFTGFMISFWMGVGATIVEGKKND